MFWLLMKVRFMGERNTILQSWHRNPALVIGLCLLGIVLFGAIFLAFSVLFMISGSQKILPAMTYEVFYFFFLFLLAGSVRFIASTLLQSNDYQLLYASPATPRGVVGARLLEAAVTNSIQFSVLGVPAIVACGAALGFSPVAWLVVPLIIVLFTLLPALLTSLVLLLLLGLLGMPRLRTIVTLLNVLMAIVVCSTLVLEVGRTSVTMANGLSSMLPAAVAGASSGPARIPSSGFARVMLQLSEQHYGPALQQLLFLILIVGGLLGINILLGARYISAEALNSEDGPSRPGSGSLSFPGQTFFRRLSSTIMAIVVKDLRYLVRDSMLFSQLSLPVILYLAPFLVMSREPIHPSGEELMVHLSVMIGVILFMHTSILSLTLLGLEGRGYWILMSSPTRISSAVFAKFIVSAGVAGSIALALSLISAVVSRSSLTVWLLQAGVLILSDAALCGLGCGIAAAFPRFIYDNPAHRVSAWALILGFFSTVGYLFISVTIFILAWIAALNYPNISLRIYIIAAAIFAFTSLGAAVFSLLLGIRRLSAYSWDN